MLFNSLDFLLFFPIVVLLYYVVPDRIKHLWLLAASYYFYMCWNAKYALLILFSTVVTYMSGLLMEQIRQTEWKAERKVRYRKLCVAGSVILNLAVLFFFKYFDFALQALGGVFKAAHIVLNIPQFDIILPVGISFYTFQALSYTMDVYRNEIHAEKNFFRYALFVSFFPQLVAGPIERSKNLLSQLKKPRRAGFDEMKDGFLLMLWGYFLKLVLADRIAVFVDCVYGDYVTYGGCYLLVATILFSVQIYCDFYAYSVIAMGAAKFLGIRLMENFDTPYFARSVAEFWRRWHISLTSWFKDYLYIPLGGSKKGKIRKCINKMIVFLVSGLWHGANWSFVVWGGINGLYQIIGEYSKPARDKIVKWLGLNRNSLGHKLLQVLITFSLVAFSWIFFRAGNLQTALDIIKNLFGQHNPWVLLNGFLYTCGLDEKNFRLMCLGICILIFADFCKYRGIRIREVIAKQDAWFQCIVVAFSVCAILTFGIWGSAYDEASFIYFQF